MDRVDALVDEEPGDIHYIVQTAPHAFFTRKKDDLHMNMDISLREALLGAKVKFLLSFYHLDVISDGCEGFERTFKHLDGHDVVVKRDGITRPCTCLNH